MAKLFVVFAVLLVAVNFASARVAGSQCEMNAEEGEKMLLSCLSHDFSLMMEIMEGIKNPNQAKMMNLLCRDQNALVDLIVCMENKISGCMSGSALDMLKSMLPSKNNWQSGVKVMCDNREDLSSDCMTPKTQEFMQCYMGKVQSTIVSFGAVTPKDGKNLLCRFVKAEENCLETLKGTCSKNYIDTLIEVIEALVPTSECPSPSVNVNPNIKQGAFDKFLVHGQPLLFKPNGGFNYNTVLG